MAVSVSFEFAEGTLTGSDQPANDETVIIGSKTYTFQASLTDSDGNVHIGDDLEETLANLYNAIRLGPGAGTAYADSMTVHPQVRAYSVSATVLVVRALGAIGNEVGTTGTWPASADAAWGASTLENGEGNIDLILADLVEHNQINSEAAQALLALTVADD